MFDYITNHPDILGIPGLGVFIYYYIKSIKTKIGTLEGVITEQDKTMSVIMRRILMQ